MDNNILKSSASLLLGCFFYYFSANGSDYLPKLIYWILVAFLLTAFFELTSMLWTQKSTICKSGYGRYYPVILTIAYFVPPVIILIKQLAGC